MNHESWILQRITEKFGPSLDRLMGGLVGGLVAAVLSTQAYQYLETFETVGAVIVKNHLDLAVEAGSKVLLSDPLVQKRRAILLDCQRDVEFARNELKSERTLTPRENQLWDQLHLTLGQQSDKLVAIQKECMSQLDAMLKLVEESSIRDPKTTRSLPLDKARPILDRCQRFAKDSDSLADAIRRVDGLIAELKALAHTQVNEDMLAELLQRIDGLLLQ